MELFLLRHADAVYEAPTDLERPLSEKGWRQSETVAKHLKGRNLRFDLILSSPARRTLQTAQVLAAELQNEILPCPWALPGMAPQEAIREIEAFRRFQRLILVGHQPDLSYLIANLLNLSSPERFHVRKASLAHLTFISTQTARLESFIPCNAM